MTPGHFVDIFERLGGTLSAAQEVRKLILNLAIRGRLSSRRLDDGDAREAKSILEAAQKDKGRVRSGTYRQGSHSPLEFEIPRSWSRVTIGEAVDLVNGRAFKPSDWTGSGVPIIRIQNLNNASAPFNRCNYQVEDKFQVQDGDLLISWSGTPGTSFGAFIWSRGPAILNQHIFRADLYSTKVFCSEFLRRTVNARLDVMIGQAHGGVGLRHITKGKLEAIEIAVPPLPGKPLTGSLVARDAMTGQIAVHGGPDIPRTGTVTGSVQRIAVRLDATEPNSRG